MLTQTFSETGAIGAFDGLTQPFDGGRTLVCQVMFIIYTEQSAQAQREFDKIKMKYQSEDYFSAFLIHQDVWLFRPVQSCRFHTRSKAKDIWNNISCARGSFWLSSLLLPVRVAGS